MSIAKRFAKINNFGMKEETLKKAMREMGARGGKRSLETMTPEERADRAKKAAAKSAEVRSKKANLKRKSRNPRRKKKYNRIEVRV